MGEIPLGNEVSKKDYAAMVEKGEVLGNKLPGLMNHKVASIGAVVLVLEAGIAVGAALAIISNELSDG